MSSDVQASKIHTAQLKLQFQSILLNPKYNLEADQFLKSSKNSVSISTSTKDGSSTAGLHSDEYKVHHAVFSEEGIPSLRRIADMLSSKSDLEECLQMYIECRKDVVIRAHMTLHERFSIETNNDFKRLINLNEKIQRWIQVAKICIGTIFVMERCFYEQIFGGLEAVEYAAIADGFVYIVSQAAAKLLEFPDSLLARPRLPRRPEILLPFYEQLTSLISDVTVLFDHGSEEFICNYVTRIMSRLKKHMAEILSTSEQQILHELSMFTIPGGGIHPLTEYVIQYIGLISVHRTPLIELETIPQVSDGMCPPEVDQGLVSLKHHLAQIIDFLLHNLKYKSNVYKQESLRHLFLMNNFQSVAEKIKSSPELEELVGTHSQMKLKKEVDSAMTDYMKTSWDDVCHFLIDAVLKPHLKCSFFPGSSTRASKKKFKKFNLMFEDVLQTQLKWIIPDEQLREKLQAGILAKLIPAYDHFLEQFSCQTEKVKNPNRYIKYHVKDLETKVLNMFQCQNVEELNLNP